MLVNYTKNVWHKFDREKGSAQARPPLRRYVLVRFDAKNESESPVVAVGYRKDAAGDKQCPYFVTPGIGGIPTHWNDCLPEDFNFIDVDKATS